MCLFIIFLLSFPCGRLLRYWEHIHSVQTIRIHASMYTATLYIVRVELA